MMDSANYQPKKQDSLEIRGVGRQLDYSTLLELSIIKIIELHANNDVNNDLLALNRFSRLVKLLEGLIRAYQDQEYYDEIYEAYRDGENSDLDIIQSKFDSISSLLKRKGFTPADDVISNSFVIIKNIMYRIKDELDAQIVIHGPRGTGKSTLAMQLCLEIAKELRVDWYVDKHVFFNANELRTFIDEERPPKGFPLLWDEAGAGGGLAKRRAMNKENKDYYEIIQTSRELGLVVFYTVPKFEQLDSGIVGEFTGEIETIKIDKLEKINLVKYKEKKGKYFNYVRTPTGDRIVAVRIDKAPESIIKKYKQRKIPFMYEKIRVKEDKKKERKTADLEKLTDLVKKNLTNYSSTRGKLKPELIYEEYRDSDGLTFNQAKKIKHDIEVEKRG